jgi:hypothetical protein
MRNFKVKIPTNASIKGIKVTNKYQTGILCKSLIIAGIFFGIIFIFASILYFVLYKYIPITDTAKTATTIIIVLYIISIVLIIISCVMASYE